MFISDPVNLQAPVDRRKQLLARLMAQLAGRGGIGTGSTGARMGMAAAGRPFRAAGDLMAGPNPMVTRLLPNLPPGLAMLLGPGGVPRPLPAEVSQRVGAPIDQPVVPGRSNPGNPLVSGPPGIIHRPIIPPGLIGPGPGPGSPPIQLGNGLILDPATGRVINPGAQAAGVLPNGTVTGKGAIV